MQRIFYSNVTFLCNNHCKNCISRSVKTKKHSNLDLFDFQLADTRFSISKEDVFNINGGEPTLWPDFESIIEWCYSKSHHIIVYTNGRLVSRLKTAIIDRIERIIIPLYGDEIDHDSYVGINGSFRETINSISYILQQNKDKLEIKLLLSEKDNIEKLMQSITWQILSKNQHFSITRVLDCYEDCKMCTKELTLRAESIICYMLEHGKTVRYYDLPFCLFSPVFRNHIKSLYNETFTYDTNVIHIKSNGRFDIFDYNQQTDYNAECEQCPDKIFCVRIMKNYFCPTLDNNQCFIMTE